MRLDDQMDKPLPDSARNDVPLATVRALVHDDLDVRDDRTDTGRRIAQVHRHVLQPGPLLAFRVGRNQAVTCNSLALGVDDLLADVITLDLLQWGDLEVGVGRPERLDVVDQVDPDSGARLVRVSPGYGVLGGGQCNHGSGQKQ